MISKVFDGHSFYHACRYVCNKPGAQVLATEGVRGHSYKLMADDFILQAELRRTKKQACFHGLLSFYPGEDPGDQLMVEIAEKYLEGIGIKNTQYAITKHTDKDHLHLHILANMVNNDGQSISDSWIALKGKRTAQRLTKEYGLIPAEKKNLDMTHQEALSRSEANRYKIYTAIMENLPQCRSLEELEKRLLHLGIETQYKYKGQTTEQQGVSFKIGDDCFKGSKVDRKFSLAGLQKILAQQQKQVAENRNVTEQRSEAAGQIPGATLTRKRLQEPRQPEAAPDLEHTITEGVAGILAELLKVEDTYQEQPYELLREARKKRKGKRR